MIPDFLRGGILPPGVHECSWDELTDRFGRGQCRSKLCTELASLRDRALRCAFVGIIIWGSFPTGHAEPGDLDLLFVTRPGVSRDNVRPECAELLDPERSRERFGHDFLSCTDDPEVLEYFAQNLGYDNRIGKQKGVLRLVL